MGRRKQMKREQRLQSARSWLETTNGEPKDIAKAYRKRYGVDWKVTFQELALLNIQVPAEYQEQVLQTVEREAEQRKAKKAERRALMLIEHGEDEEWLSFEPAPKRARKKSDVPYDELDPNIVSLVRALNGYPAVTTMGSCGGHEHPTNASQWDAGSWYVKFDLAADRLGWRVLEFLAWAINEDCRVLGGENVVLLPTSAPPYLNTPGACLAFVIEGRDGVDPEELAQFLNEIRNLLITK